MKARLASHSRLLGTTIRFGSRREVRHGLLVASAVFAVVMVRAAASGDPYVGYDAHAYWAAAGLSDPYASTIAGGFGGQGGLYEYKYPPILAQALFPAHWLPWPIFLGLWTALLLLCLSMVTGRLMLLALFLPPVLGELWLGNVNLLIGLAIVLGFRWPAAWAFVILTKITPGIGLLWFVARREWRSLGIALGASAAIAAVSFLIAPGLWADFAAAMKTQLDPAMGSAGQAIPLPLPLRLAVGSILIVWGARSERRWVLPVAAAIAVPFSWWNIATIGLAAIPLVVPQATPLLARISGTSADGPAVNGVPAR